MRETVEEGVAVVNTGSEKAVNENRRRVQEGRMEMVNVS